MKIRYITVLVMAMFSMFLLFAANAQDDDAFLDDLLGDIEEDSADAVAEGETVAPEAEEMDDEAGLDELLGEMEDAEESQADEAAAEMEEEEDMVAGGEEEQPSTETVMMEGPAASPEDLERQQLIAMQAREKEGKLTLEEAEDLIEKRRYEKALTALRDGLSKLPERPANEELIKQTHQKIVSVQLERARATLRTGDFESALAQLSASRESLDMVDGKFKENISEEMEDLSRDIDKAAERFERKNTPEAIELREIRTADETVEGLIDSGKRMMALTRYDEAENYLKKALNMDPYNKDAMRLLRKIEETRFKISTVERQTTVDKMIQDVRQTWNPPIKVELETPSDIGAGRERYTKSETQELRKKMEGIIIPSIEFRQANIVDVIDFLREASAAADPEGVGVNIISKIPETGGGSTQSEEPEPFRQPEPADDIWGDFNFDVEDNARGGGGGGSQVGSGTSSIPTITLNLRRVSLMDAIKYVTEVATLKYRLEKNVVIITPADAVEGQIITRMYPVQPSFLDVVVTRSEDEQNRTGGGGGGQFIEMGSSSISMDKTDVKEFFINSGVKFPTGTSITYNKSISQLIVSNTPENLEVFESILAQLNVVPKQVEIETRFVEVAQNDLEELGFEWLLNDNYEMLVKNGTGPVGGRERIIMNANATSGGFTSGVRFFNDTESGISPSSAVSTGGSGSLVGIGAIMGISSVLTNPEVSMILHALDQKGGSDLLSAPRVTTRSGVNAEIKVIREIIYPTEFENEVQNVETTDDQGRRINSRQIVVTPEGFETRETGVIMNVTPTVGPDGYTIDLSMVPEVVELVDWIQYGTEEYNMPQPVFSKRTVATSIIIWDGQTVVMGGMIREQITTVDDKIPLLGDIPLLGRFFKNKGEYSQKQNLLIFVTARLVDPAGNRIRKPGEQTPSQPAG